MGKVEAATAIEAVEAIIGPNGAIRRGNWDFWGQNAAGRECLCLSVRVSGASIGEFWKLLICRRND